MTTLSAPTGFRGTFRADDDACAVYSEAAGIGRALPRAVAVPVDPDDLVVLVKWAADGRIPLIPRGSGSSMPGGAIGDGVIVDLSRWRKLGSVDTHRRTIRVGPGITRGEVDAAARAQGLRFPVDPSSGAFCTVGGMASTNAAGSHSLRFGSMRPWVVALDCVFADGSRAEISRIANAPAVIPSGARSAESRDPRPDGEPGFLLDARRSLDSRFALARDDDGSRPALAGDGDRSALSRDGMPTVLKNSSGYAIDRYSQSHDLVDLLVGSEGTLALFVELELKLEPVAAATSSVLGAFSRLERAVTAATAARDAGAVACELLDKTFLDVAASGGATRHVPEGTESALLAEVEGATPEDANAAALRIQQIFQDAGATTTRIALNPDTETELWELRHAASPILARLDPNLRSLQFIEDTAVPPEHLPSYVRGLRDIFARNDTRGVIFGHAGDSHIHANALVDFRNPDWRERIDRILDEVVDLTHRLGGTLAGEHGDGRVRTPLLPRVWSSQAIEAFAAVKHAFDPLGILNPGVKVATPNEVPIGDVKYDPTLPPLPDRARAALQRVERERAYTRSRLELLDEADPR